MQLSFTLMQQVNAETIHSRLEPVRALRENELELYELMKDRLTGEHYLHYAYVHRSLAAVGPGAGEEEAFHHLMPLDSDDVLGMLFGEQPYVYPDHWSKAFLRNGPDDKYVWFDPAYRNEQEESEAYGKELMAELARFKEAGDLSEEAVSRLLDKIKQVPNEQSD